MLDQPESAVFRHGKHMLGFIGVWLLDAFRAVTAVEGGFSNNMRSRVVHGLA